MFEKIGKVFSGIANAASKVASVLAPVGKAIKFVGTALVGIPLAAVATAGLAITYAIAQAARIFDSKTLTSLFGKSIATDARWDSIVDWLSGAMGKVWTNFGIYPYLTGAKWAEKRMDENLDEAGTGSAQGNEEPTASYENITAVKTHDEQVNEVREDVKHWTKNPSHSPHHPTAKIVTPSHEKTH